MNVNMKKMTAKVTLSTAVFALGLGVLPSTGVLDHTPLAVTQVDAATTKYKTKSDLNMRSGASVKHKVVTVVKKGKEVSYISKSGSWYKVKHGGKTGYVSSKYLTKVAPPKKATPKPKATPKATATATKYKTSANLNMRTGASTKYKKVTTIPKGKEVSYVSKSGSWYKVRYGSKSGYVSSAYLKKVSTAKPAPKPVAKPAPKPVAKPKPVVKNPATPKAVTATKYYTTADLNMRTGASTKYKKVTTVPKGKAVTYVSKSGTWYKVQYGGKSGYVSSSYLSKTAPKKAVAVKYSAPSTKTPGKYVDGVLIVNKKYSLPSNYNPGVNPTAQKAVNAMVSDAGKQGIYLNPFSTFRSYSRQTQLYNNYVRNYGKTQADRFSAKPGTSEHQTGLAFDFGGRNTSLWAEDAFANTTEAKWLANNAQKYGFVLRYPKGKEKVTGYMYEPWHFRYVGTDVATKVKASGKTLEEYFKVSGK